MTWKNPETEKEWEEYLSAYMDGEMTADDIIEFERLLKKNPQWTAQLEELRKTSISLREWEIDVPEPAPVFVRKVRGLVQMKKKPAWKSWFGSWRMQPILSSFITGIFIGIVFMAFIDMDDNKVTIQAPKENLMTSETAISPAQAHMLLETEELRVKVLNELDQMNIGSAMEYYNELKEKYPESRALRDLYENRTLRLLQKGVRLASY